MIVPTFDEMGSGVDMCDSELCCKCVDVFFDLDVRDDGQGLVPALGFSARRTLSSRVPFVDVGVAPRSHSSPQSDTSDSPLENFAIVSDGGGSGGSRASPGGEEAAGLFESEAPRGTSDGGPPWAADAVAVAGARGGVAASQGTWQQPPSGGAQARGGIGRSGGVSGGLVRPKVSIVARRRSAMPEQKVVERQVLSKTDGHEYHVGTKGWRQKRGDDEEGTAPFPFLSVQPRWPNGDLAQVERQPDSMHCVGLSPRLEAEALQYGSEWIETSRAESREKHSQKMFERASPFNEGDGFGPLPPHAQSHGMPPGGWEGNCLEGSGGGGAGRGWGGTGGEAPSPDVAYAFDSEGMPSFQPGGAGGRGQEIESAAALVQTVDDAGLWGTLTAPADEDAGMASRLPLRASRSGAAACDNAGGRRRGDNRPGESHSGAHAYGVAGACYGASQVNGQVVLTEAPWVGKQIDERSWAQTEGKARHTSSGEYSVCPDLAGILLGDEGGGGGGGGEAMS